MSKMMDKMKEQSLEKERKAVAENINRLTRSIYRHGKPTITYRKRRQRVETRHMRIVTLQQRLAVDRSLFTLASNKAEYCCYTYDCIFLHIN